MKNTIKVASAILENKDHKILCALRSPSMSHPNLWEFPGGKIEEWESIGEAIVREIKEELLCDIEFIEIFNDNIYEYDDVIVNLIATRCKIINGEPRATEHSEIKWVSKSDLKNLTWTPADIKAVDALIETE
ncbi:(deoxy)nucleoside triphosphate pyrophosphohydrolase [Clostridium sardiniense]|uniref:(deoxy)nucleoside triphosphate pyrophosphohydrolase n=1 Tax=Clostridium sardiniense TaxID=29369 RepID=UPI003D330C9B